MRNITSKAIEAFNNDFSFSESNTNVTISFGSHPKIKSYKGELTVLSIFGNDIAIKTNKGLYITNCGFKTNTTKERLNGLDGVNIHQKSGEWFLNGEKWNGEITKIS